MNGHPFIFGAGAGLGGGGGGGSISSLVISDLTPDFGDTVTITATPSSGFVPTSYLFFVYDGSNITFIAEQAGNAANWLVNSFGSLEIYVLATDGTIEVYSKEDITVAAVFVCDLITPQPVAAFSLRRVSASYLGDAALIRRSSDNATASIGFVGQDWDTTALITHVGIGGGFEAALYDQIGLSNATQGTAAAQPTVVVSGTVQLLGGKPTLVFDGGNDDLAISPPITFVHAFTVAAKASDTNLAQFLLGGNVQGLNIGGTTGSVISVATAGGNLVGSVSDTNPHQVSFKLGGAGAGRLRVDGVTKATGTTSVNMTISILGTRSDVPTLRYIGRFSETILYPAALTNAEELIIENNQMTYYAI